MNVHREFHGWLLAVALGISLPGMADDMQPQTCDGLDCLLCPALQEPASYSEGSMRLMKYLVPGRDRWLFRSEVDFSHEFGIPEAVYPEFGRLVDRLEARGTSLAMVIQPTRGLMHQDKLRSDWPYTFDTELARSNLAHYLDQLRIAGALVPDWLQLVDQPPQDDYFFRRDHHWTPAGSRVTAGLLADLLRQQPWYADLPERHYITEQSVTQFKDGTLNVALQYLCGNHYGFQYVPGYQTVPVVEDTAAALFGDHPDPEVVLVGTSNTASREDASKHYNFDGFLQELLGTEVLNHALPGAGEYGSLISYLHSDSYQPDDPPRVLVWELPANYRLHDPLMYRQLIPALQGQCRADATRITQSVHQVPVAENTRIELLSNAGRNRLRLRGMQGYLDLRISDPNLKHFYLLVYYDNGQRDKVWYRREAIVSGGQYYLELSRDPVLQQANILSVFMEPTQNLAAPVDMEIRLCHY